MGSSAYAVSAAMAMRAARSPIQGNGNRKPKSARLGMVWMIFTTPSTGLAQRGCRVSQMPVGTPMAAANNIADPVSHRCSRVSSAISEACCG